MSSAHTTVSPYRWTVLAAGVFATAANSAILLGLPAIAPALRHAYDLTLTQVGVVLAALNFGALATLLLWGIVADRIGERRVIAAGQVGAAVALVWAARTSSYGALVAALSVTGALGAGVNAASGRAVMGGSANTSEGWLWGYGRWASHWAGPSPPARSRR